MIAMMPITLPCIHCGYPIPLTKGATAQCFICGTTNGFMDSYELLSDALVEIFGYTGEMDVINKDIDNETLYSRLTAVDSHFNDLLMKIRRIDYMVLSKLDGPISEEDVLELAKSTGVLGIIIEFYILPIIKDDIQKNQYREIMNLLKIRNLQLSGLDFSIKAYEAFNPDDAKELYIKSALCFEQAEKQTRIYNEKEGMDFGDEMILCRAADSFANLLSEFISNNPAYYADDLESLEILLKDLLDVRATTMKKQIMEIYSLSTSFMYLLEEIRNKKPFDALEIRYERIPFYTQEIKEDFNTAKKWLLEIEEKFNNYKRTIVKLHCGRIISYLEVFQKEFGIRMNELKETFDELIKQYIPMTLSDFAMEVDDDFELIDVLIENNTFDPYEIADRFENIRFNLDALEETVKKFLLDLMDMAFDEDIKRKHLKDLVESVSERHSVYDQRVYSFINLLIEQFIDKRDKERMQIERQKEIFLKEYDPIIKRLIDASYALKYEEMPLPLLIELVVLKSKLDIGETNRMVLLLENMAPVPLRDVGVTFFVPNTFMIQRRAIRIGKLKSRQKVSVDTEFVPTEDGRYKIMAMVNYNHFNDSFWMPSIQIPIVVGNPEKQDEKLLQLYKKYGIDPNRIEEIKEMAREIEEEVEEEEEEAVSDDELKELLEKYPHLSALPDETVEKDDLLKALKEVEELEDEIKEDSYYDDEPYKDVDLDSEGD